MSGNIDRGRSNDTMADSKAYNPTAPAPVDTGVGRTSSTHSHSHSRSASSHSASNSPRIGSATTTSEHHKRHSSSGGVQGRRGYNDSPSTPDNNLTPSKSHSGHLSPVIRDDRSLSRGRSSSEASHRSGSQTGLAGRRGYNEEPGARDSRSSSTASGSSSARRASESGANFNPRVHAGMIGRKGYNSENPVAVAEAKESVGLGISDEQSPKRLDGIAGRHGYNKTPSPRRGA